MGYLGYSIDEFTSSDIIYIEIVKRGGIKWKN
jgi:hypothetical protein